jgi:hypothetical protein
MMPSLSICILPYEHPFHDFPELISIALPRGDSVLKQSPVFEFDDPGIDG